MEYKYQLEIDQNISFEDAVRLLKERIKNSVHTGPIRSEVEDWDGHIRGELTERGIAVNDLYVHRNDYQRYLEQAQYQQKYPDYYSGNLPEKSLEHFISFKLLDCWEDDVLLDIASEQSPVHDIYSRLSGCVCYSQDIMYRPGIHGSKIGSNVESIPVPDGFFSKALATCSIEHFEGDSDIQFMKEMQRVLKPCGRLVVLPLYVATRSCAITDPRYALAGNVSFDEDAEVYCVENWGNRHGRFYSPATLYERLIRDHVDMRFRIYDLRNPQEIDASIYCKFVLLCEKLPFAP
jgi:SAM-dependent methyltransferase